MEQEDRKGNILVVDDDESVCTSLREILRGQYSVFIANSAKMALEVIRQNSHGDICSVDLVITDICMSQMDGLELLKKIKQKNPRVEVIMITGFPSPENTLNALRFGASDYIVKPFQAPDVLESVRKVMDKRKESVKVERIIEDLKVAIQKNYSATTEALIMAINAKDNYTKEHCERVANLMVEFAKELGLDSEKQELLRKISLLHDIGKIGVREQVLNKRDRLTPEEWEEVKHHPFVGYQIIQCVEFLKDGRDIMLYHQERFDGTGYPAGLKGEAIPLGARMLGIVDSYDAMVTDRPYRKKMSIENALEELKRCSGTQFDPELVNVFVKMMEKKIQIPVTKPAGFKKGGCMKRILLLVLVFSFVWVPYLLASGFFLYYQDVKAQGQAGAFTAQADNPSAVYYNPAGMSQLDGTQVSLGSRFIRLETEYKNLLGIDEDLEAEWAVVPSGFITSDLNTEKWTFGLGVYAPFGLSTSWSGTGLLRYVATDSSFKMVDINPSIAYQILPELSIGGGINYYNVYSYILEYKQNFILSDADVGLDMDGDGWGFNLGLLWKPHPKHSFGLAYRSRVDIELSGNLKIENIPVGLGYPSILRYNTKQDITIPSIVSGGYAFRPVDKLKLEFDINWVEWSTFDKADLKDEDTGVLISTTDLDWGDTWIFALGGEYLLTEKLALRAGYCFVENAVPEKAFTPAVPDSDMHAITLGLGYTLDRVTIDLAYGIGFYEERDIDNNIGANVGTTVSGKYDSLIHIIGVSVGFRF